MLSKQLQQIRNQNRISSREAINYLFTDFVELHGDRVLGDDAALIGGIAFFDGQPMTVLGINRGKTLAQRQASNGGMVNVSGYKKALRLVQAAQRFKRPVISFIDMPGADASVYSEQHGQSQAIAEMIAAMGILTTPNISIFLGEGHSGGALAFANTNRIIMLEHALFSVASPEAVAAIVTTKDDLNQYLPMTAQQLNQIGLVDEIVDEKNVLINLRQALKQQLAPLRAMTSTELITQRQQKYLDIINNF